ncbi:MAG: PAS domain S-box protein [Nitrospirae bacterium]|nr:PAS domain S-box protein [Nitrospirota bacterium]
MDKENYIKQEIYRTNKTFASLLIISGGLTIIGLSLLDYFATPHFFKIFFIYRLIASSLFAIMYFIYKKVNNYPEAFLIIGTIIVSSMVEVMILHLGGHKSPYYAGMIIIVMFLLGLLPISFTLSLIIASIIYGIYLFPILIFDKITDINIFMNNNIFLLACIISGLMWRYLNFKFHLKKLSVEYELFQKTEELKKYSVQLEDLVQERTKAYKISEAWYRSIFDNATDAIIITDTTGKITSVNNKFYQMYGFDSKSLQNASIELLEPSENKEKIEKRNQRILNGETILYETTHFKKNGEKIYVEISSRALDIGDKIHILYFCRDITEKKRIQEQLIHSQKMESIGALAGGIAHNFNNILTAILGNSELLLEYSQLDEVSKKKVRNIEGASRKAGIMVSKLLSFARKDSTEKVPFNLNDVINDSAKLFDGVLDKKIGVKITLDENIPFIEGEPNQIEQVIMNLIVNAKDAMPDGGLIEIKTNFVKIEDKSSHFPVYVTPGNYVVMSVSDTGTGIPDEIKQKIFDPFFTTKEKGKGTGLGLATVYGIVKDHNGYVSVDSEVGKGTCFYIYIPASEKIAYNLKKPVQPVLQGFGNILLIDDDKDVLQFIKDLLESHGYIVIAENNPLNAINLFKEQNKNIHLVITDIMMPLMGGEEVIMHLREIRKDIKILAMSGYLDKPLQNLHLIIDAYLKKPFEKNDMLFTIKNLLDSNKKSLPFY